MKKNKTYYFIIILIIIQSIVFYQWVFSNNLFTFGDIGLYTSITQPYLFEQVQSIYKVHTDFGALDITASNYPFLFIFGLLGKIGINFIRSSKIMLFWPVVFGVVLNSFFFIKYFTRDNFSAFFSSLFYSYGFYFLITLTGALYISFAYAFAPLLMLLFFKTIQNPNIKQGIFLGLGASFLGFIEFRILYILLRICLLYFCYYLIIKKISFQNMVQYLKIFGLSGVIICLLNSFWILPLVFQGQITNNALFSRELFGGVYFDLWNAFSMMHPRRNWGEPTIFIKQNAPAFLAIIPLLLILGLIRHRKSFTFLFFSFIFLLGVFLTKQSSEPFSGFYLWLYQNFPGFNAFREASKFFIVSSLSFSVLMGLFFKINNKKNTFQLLLFLSFLFVILSNMFVVVSGKLGTMFLPRQYEKDIEELNKFFIKDDSFYRILWLPHINKFSDYNYNHPAISLLSTYETIYSGLNHETNISLEKTFQNILSHPDFIKRLGQQSVKYIILPRNLVRDDVASPWKEPGLYTKILNQKEGIKKIYENRGNFIYEVKKFLPRFVLEEVPIKIYNITNTKFLLGLEKIKGIKKMNFSDNFNSDWKLYLELYSQKSCKNPQIYTGESLNLGSGDNQTGFAYHVTECEREKKNNFIEGIKKLREQPLFDDTHQLVNDYANGRTIDAEYIKKNFPKEYYKLNPDGAIDANLTLYFKPQSYFYLGLGVSELTFLGLITRLIIDRKKQKKSDPKQ